MPRIYLMNVHFDMYRHCLTRKAVIIVYRETSINISISEEMHLCGKCGRSFQSESGLFTHFLFLCWGKRKVKGEVEDTILLSSTSTTPVQERGGARGDKALHDTFIRFSSTLSFYL